MNIQADLHNRLVGEIVASIVKPPLEHGGDIKDIMVLLESVVAGVLLAAVKLGGDNIVLDVLIEGVKARATEILASKRLGSIDPAGRA